MKVSEILDVQNKKRGQVDFWFFFSAIALLAIGLLMVFSASSEASRNEFGNSYHFILRQGIFALLGLMGMAVLMNINYRIWGKYSAAILGVVVVLLVAVLLVGTSTKGGKRWISFGFFQLQPSELAKMGLIIFLSYSLSKNAHKLNKFWTGFIPYIGVIGAIDLLIILENHFSATVIVTLSALTVLFVAGARIRHFLYIGAPVAALGVIAVALEPYRLARVTSFLDPWADPLGAGWQIINSLLAIGSGGMFGLGLGKSRQKFSYIPEPHNDFIFSILCEEMGFLGALIVVILFAVLVWRGIVIATRAPDRFGGFMVTGLISIIAIQTILNFAVVTSSMPVTGMPLPFFSYGGTAMLVNMAEVGLILNVSRYGKK